MSSSLAPLFLIATCKISHNQRIFASFLQVGSSRLANSSTSNGADDGYTLQLVRLSCFLPLSLCDALSPTQPLCALRLLHPNKWVCLQSVLIFISFPGFTCKSVEYNISPFCPILRFFAVRLRNWASLKTSYEYKEHSAYICETIVF